MFFFFGCLIQGFFETHRRQDKKVAILNKSHTDMKSDKREPYHKSCHVDISIPEVMEKTCIFIKFLPKVQSDIMMKK